jgi:hypothetical protein
MIPFNGWTVFSITDGTNTVRVDCRSVKKGIANAITFISIPKAPASQPLSSDPEVTALDLKRISHSLTISGFLVDDTDNGGDTVPQKVQKLDYMAERKKAPFSATYRGITYSSNIYITKVAYDDSDDTYIRTGSSLIDSSRLTKIGVTLDITRATRRS